MDTETGGDLRKGGTFYTMGVDVRAIIAMIGFELAKKIA